MVNLTATKPLQCEAVCRPGFSVEQSCEFGLIRLQTFHRTAGMVDRVAAKLGLVLPAPEAAVQKGDMLMFGSAPGEWVIVVPAGTEHDRRLQIQSQGDGLFMVLTHMTDSRVTMKLSGEKVRQVLARGSSVDFHPTVFGVESCLSTRFAGVPLTLLVLPDNQFLLFACRSVAAYLFDWFQAASSDC